MAHPLLQSLPETHRYRFEKHIVHKDYEKGEVIFRQGENVRGLYFIDQGLVQFQIDQPSGKSTFIGIAKENTYLGDCELLAKLQHFAIAIAATNCHISLLPGFCFAEAMQEAPEFSHAVAVRLAKNLHLLQMVQMVRHQWTVEQKLAGIIIYLATHFGSLMENGHYRIEVALSQDQLASMAGLTRQSIHKPLQLWKEVGWIDYHYGNMLVQSLDPFLKLVADHVLEPQHLTT